MKKISYEIEVPVYYSAEELRKEPRILEGQIAKKPGKIIWVGDYIFMSDAQEGIHLIDNTDPKNPRPIRFLHIEGNWDMAMKGNMLYADSYTDLLVFDCTVMAAPKFLNRIQDVWNLDNVLGRFLEANLKEEVIKEVKLSKREYNVPCYDEVETFARSTDMGQSQGGSMARFCLVGDYLYGVDNSQLYVFSVKQKEKPLLVKSLNVDLNIETIFSYANRLFIGGMSGVYIYDKTDPENPKKLSQFKHVESCDPIVVDKNIAFVTLRTDANCQNADNLLVLLNIKDIENPLLLAQYPMQNPHGLAVKENRLYLCEGVHGLKVYDVSDLMQIDKNLLVQDSSLHAYDVIANKDKPLLLLVGKTGLVQYALEAGKLPQKISELKSFFVAK